MKVSDVASWLESVAPLAQAEPGDNVGLLVGDPGRETSTVLFTIDLTDGVWDEALRVGATFVVAYHPPIYEAAKRFVAPSVPYRAAAAGVAIYSPHTALDVADGGTNDVLADACGIAKADRAPLRARATADHQHKLVTFVPNDALERVGDAIFAAGAGRIGGYSACSFRSAGQGTYFGGEGTSPARGKAGRLELADETRIETVVPEAKVRAVLRALRDAHPYEEPAFDLVRLAAPPQATGLGRIGEAPARTLAEHAASIKAALGLGGILVAGDPRATASRIAVGAGSCGDLWKEARRAGADLYVTGEMRHHDALAAVAAGLPVLCTLHSNSERRALVSLASRMRAALPALGVHVSDADRDPFAFA